jgi:hypothetical protein
LRAGENSDTRIAGLRFAHPGFSFVVLTCDAASAMVRLVPSTGFGKYLAMSAVFDITASTISRLRFEDAAAMMLMPAISARRM